MKIIPLPGKIGVASVEEYIRAMKAGRNSRTSSIFQDSKNTSSSITIKKFNKRKKLISKLIEEAGSAEIIDVRDQNKK